MIDDARAILWEHMLADKLVGPPLRQSRRVCFNFTVSDDDLGRTQIVASMIITCKPLSASRGNYGI
jgi:hypothetical protein